MGERWKGLSGPEDLPGVDDLLGSFRWYDALCINQNNLEERSHQVELMRDIYRSATSVNVWLGHEGQGTEDLFQLLQLVRKRIGRFLEVSNMDFNELLNNRDLLYIYFGAEVERYRFIPLLDVLKWRYWTQIWIVQEFVLARSLTICCGWASIDWETFASCLKWVFEYDQRHDGLFFSGVIQRSKDVQEIQGSVGMKISMTRIVGKKTQRFGS
jgi:hypothetical protein